MNMYSIKDEVAGVFFQPCFLTHDVVAIRMVRGLLKDQDSLLYRFPSDYALYRVGRWDEMTGMITQDEIVKLGIVSDFLEKDEKNEEEPG